MRKGGQVHEKLTQPCACFSCTANTGQAREGACAGQTPAQESRPLNVNQGGMAKPITGAVGTCGTPRLPAPLGTTYILCRSCGGPQDSPAALQKLAELKFFWPPPGGGGQIGDNVHQNWDHFPTPGLTLPWVF